MKNLLAILVAGFALVGCSQNSEGSANANASATEASAPVAQPEAATATATVETASGPVTASATTN